MPFSLLDLKKSLRFANGYFYFASSGTMCCSSGEVAAGGGRCFPLREENGLWRGKKRRSPMHAGTVQRLHGPTPSPPRFAHHLPRQSGHSPMFPLSGHQ